jgi:formylglycine-generating enzyme required for sulfatase activity
MPWPAIDSDAMDEPEEVPTGRPGPPPAPLPRLWKTEPEPEEPEVPKKKKKNSAAGDDTEGAAPKVARKAKTEKKPKGSSKGADGSEKGKLLEETPTLDTYEARRTARIITGAAVVGIFLIFGWILYQIFGPDRSEPSDAAVDEGMLTQRPSADPQQWEREARNMFSRAREVATRGNTDLAVSLLRKVTESYPKTKSAQEAREALERPGKKLPLFLDGKAVVASATEPAKPPPNATEPPPVVEAMKVETPDATKAEAHLVLPANPAEPGAATTPNVTTAKDETPSKPLPAGFRKRPGTRIHDSGWPAEIVGDRDGAPMVLVPGGTFTMGRDDGDPTEAPAHKVSLSPYYIDLHEVTNRQFDLFQKEVGRRSERERALAKLATPLDTSEDAPVVMVSAKDAKDYAEWAGKRMATEAQWEMAARGTDGRLYPWGNEPTQWARPRKPRQIDPIRSFPNDESPLGVFDLAGNAWEWTKDWYDPKYFQLFKNSVADNPTGPSKRPPSQQLVVKGCAKNWTVTKREGLRVDTRLPYLGFRCVLPVEGVGNPPPQAVPQPNQPAPNGGNIPF